jgi:hypothetical protein
MSSVFGSSFQKGQKLSELLKKINGTMDSGKAVSLEIDDRSLPYLDHAVVAWTDGPPTSTVAWVLSAEEPGAQAWRRFTISKTGPWKYRLASFPTPFHNPVDPLAPGIPPTSSKHGKSF